MCLVVGKPLDQQCGYSLEGRGIPVTAGREQHRDAIGVQASRDEAKSGQRLVIEAVRVVDNAEHRPRRGGLSEERQRRQSNEEPVRWLTVPETEGRFERRTLRTGQAANAAQERDQEPVHAGERQIPLGLEAIDAHHLEVVGSPHRTIEQRRLADARFAVKHQCAAHALTSGGQQTVQRRSFDPATDHLHAGER